MVGHRWSDRSHELKMFLARNHVPYRWYDIERDAEAQRLSELAQAGPSICRWCWCPAARPSARPAAWTWPARSGCTPAPSSRCTTSASSAAVRPDLAAAVYAASEGLSTVVVEREAPGGQAGQSAAIENYLGFPKGLSGADLAQRAIAQVSRFGAEMVLARDVVGSGESRTGPRGALRRWRGDRSPIDDRRDRGVLSPTAAVGPGGAQRSRSLLRRDASEASQCEGDDVYIVGAANSAGQAALNLARYARRVVLVVRGETLLRTMSQYLVDRITATPNIEVRCRSEVVPVRGRASGADHLGRPDDRRHDRRLPASWLFIFIGASPRTEWLGADVVRDRRASCVDRPRPARPRTRAALADRATAVRAGDECAGSVRRRRRPVRLDEAGRLRRRRGRDVDLSRAPLPGDDLMRYRRLCARCRSSTA